MQAIPPELQTRFEDHLGSKAIPDPQLWSYRKWLRYYLDFCEKYHFSSRDQKSLPRFMGKLRDKKQTEQQQRQAAEAIKLYYEVLAQEYTPPRTPRPQPVYRQEGVPYKDSKPLVISESPVTAVQPQRVVPVPSRNSAPLSGAYRVPKPVRVSGMPSIIPPDKNNPASQPKQRDNASWELEYSQLADEIHVRHYSKKTLETYQGWMKKFQTFTHSKSPAMLSTDDVKNFLTFLAVKKKVSATTQNQAFNSLLFFYRHVLHKEFGQVEGVVRAKRKPYIPVVLSRDEINDIVKHLDPPYDLIVKLLYGCGLRLFECLGLRVQCMNFDAGILTVHDGKGQKDRTVPLPQTILPELRAHLESLKVLHQNDLNRGYAGVFLVNALEQKYKNAAREFIWQWFFPAKQLTFDSNAGEYRRYRLHETHVQHAIKQAVGKARITKRATAHTFRHSFASHLLQGNYDIRTIQELLGHSDVRTTMIYTHTVKSVTIKDARSPLDF